MARHRALGRVDSTEAPRVAASVFPTGAGWINGCIVCNPANENGDGHCEWPSPFEHRNERMNSMILEALLAAIGSTGYVAIQVRWAGYERHGIGQHCDPGAG